MRFHAPKVRASALCALLFATVLPNYGQTAPAPVASPAGSEAITLSPFTVTSENDNGYAATETLAGTRLRTNLRDIASSMSVLTPEMLRDLGANSLDEAVDFLPSSDKLTTSQGNVSGNGNFDGYNFRFGNGQQFSIRGVQVNGYSSDFFDTQAPSDLFNTESLTISRGPNSILFGTGGPAGTALVTSKRALVNRTKTQLTFQTDRWGTIRSALDHNQVLLRGKAALRINALTEDRREFRTNEGQMQQRLALALTVKPRDGTTVSVLHENWKFARNQVAMSPWFSSGLLSWVAAGRPTVDFVSADRAWNAGGRTFVDASGRPVPVAAGVTDADGFVDAQADFDPKNFLVQNNTPGNFYLSGLGLAKPVWNLRYQPTIRDDTFDGITGRNSAPNALSLVDQFQIPLDANFVAGSREHPSYEAWGGWTQAFFEQKIATGLYLEIAANFAEKRVAVSPLQDSYVKVDVAKYLPDNSLNPGYLKPYTEITPQLNTDRSRSQDLRATLSYELNATRWNEWLGRHSFAGLWQRSVVNSQVDRKKVFNMASVGQTAGGWSVDPEAAQHFLQIRRYIINGAVDNLMNPKTLIETMSTTAQQGTLAGSVNAVQPAINQTVRLFTAGQKSWQETESQSFAWQSHWLKDRLVTTVGVRKDEIATRALQGGRGDYSPAIPVPTPLPAGQSLANYSYFTPAADLVLPSTPIVNSGVTKTFAGVLHAARWLSLTYNSSANFTPPGSTTTDMMGRPKKNAEGTTKDMGLRFFFLNNRVIVSANYFENKVLNNSAGAGAFNSGYGTIITTLRTNYKNRGDSHFASMLDAYPSESPNVSSYSSITTTGNEVSITLNPSRNWRMLLTGSKNNIRSTDLYPDAFEFLFTKNQFSDFTGVETWKNMLAELRKVSSGQRSSQFDLDPNNATDRQQATTDATTISNNITAVERRWSDAQALDGARLAPQGEYAANALVNYSFTDGKLKGLGLGMNGRWRSGGVAGYYRLPNAVTGTPEGSLDVKRPIKGDAFLEFGAVVSYQWKISKRLSTRLQLNVENLFDYDKLLLRAVGTDSAGIFGPQYAYVPLRWELRRPRNFKLAATFDF